MILVEILVMRDNFQRETKETISSVSTERVAKPLSKESLTIRRQCDRRFHTFTVQPIGTGTGHAVGTILASARQPRRTRHRERVV